MPATQVTYSVGVQEAIPDSTLAALAQRTDTTAGAFFKFQTRAMQAIASADQPTELLQFELGALGILRLRLQDDSLADPVDSTWTFADTVDASTQVVLSRSDSAFAGLVWTNGATYRIDRVDGDVYFLGRSNDKPFLPELPHRSVSPPSPSRPRGAAADRLKDVGCLPQLVTVLVGVPAADVSALGGMAQLTARVRAAVGATNVALFNSLIPHRIRLGGIVELPGASSGRLATDLTHLESPSDGVYDDLLMQRDARRADLLALWVKSATDACGLGYLITDFDTQANLALFTVSDPCAVENLTFAHELGHNLGLEHDRANAAMPPSQPWAFGFQQPSGRGRDIMAYDCARGCPRAPMYSSPNLLWAGNPLGVDAMDARRSADAARALRENGCYAARFRS